MGPGASWALTTGQATQSSGTIVRHAPLASLELAHVVDGFEGGTVGWGGSQETDAARTVLFEPVLAFGPDPTRSTVAEP